MGGYYVRKIQGNGSGNVELDNLVACFVALDAAAKTANIRIQGVERNRLKSGACVKMRGSVSDCPRCHGSGSGSCEAHGEGNFSEYYCFAVRGYGDRSGNDHSEVAGGMER